MEEIKQEIIQLAEKSWESKEFAKTLSNVMYKLPTIERGQFLLEIGFELYAHSHFIAALSIWKQALKYFIKVKHRVGQAACYMGMGFVHDKIGEYKQSIYNHKKSLRLRLKCEDNNSKARGYKILSNIYISMFKFLGDFLFA